MRNAEIAAEIYPGWTCRYYLGQGVSPDLLQKLGAFPHVELVATGEPPGWRGMFWRFRPVAEKDVEVLLVRDVDCRLSRREVAAVLEWLGSPHGFHIMRDHPHHRTEILGGMWGVKRGVLPNLQKWIRRYKPGKSYWQIDQDFLRDRVFPKIRETTLLHDEFFGGSPFPTPRNGTEFVGQAFDEKERPLHPEHGPLTAQKPTSNDFPAGSVRAPSSVSWSKKKTTGEYAITLLVPSYGRPSNMRDLAHSVEATASSPQQVGIAFGLHPDDGESLQVADSLERKVRIRVQIVLLTRDPELNLSSLWNRLYQSTKEPIVGFFGDDVVFRSPGWDFSVREEFRRDRQVLVYGDDRFQSGRLATLFFTHRQVHDQFGYYMPEKFRRWYMDTWWDEIYRSRKRAHYRPDLIFDHLHPYRHPERADKSFQHLESLIPQDKDRWESPQNRKELKRAKNRFRMMIWHANWEKLLKRTTSWRQFRQGTPRGV